jgi:hypothetical protein
MPPDSDSDRVITKRHRWALGLMPCLLVVSVAAGWILTSPQPCSAAISAPKTPATVWLCRPGLKPDPCQWNRSTTAVRASGDKSFVPSRTSASASRFDCFYVYPTASHETSANADLVVQSGETNAAIALASRFSQLCQVYAPMYRQMTWNSIFGGFSHPDSLASVDKVAYQSVLAGFENYLAQYNHGRPVILLGDSQGSAMLILLMQHLIDDNPSLRRRLVVAILPGANVVVRSGQLVGGSFSHIPLCSKARQARCVIAYSSFPGIPPQGSVFGRPGQGVSALAGQTSKSGLQVACVNPAAFGAGSAPLDSFFPVLSNVGLNSIDVGKVRTSWVEYPGLYQGSCQSRDGATWLEVTKATGSSDHRPLVSEALGPTWGYHIDDVNLALGNLLADTAAAEATWER